jgi:hypothetical protein
VTSHVAHRIDLQQDECVEFRSYNYARAVGGMFICTWIGRGAQKSLPTCRALFDEYARANDMHGTDGVGRIVSDPHFSLCSPCSCVCREPE